MDESEVSNLMTLAKYDAAAFEVLSETPRLEAIAGFHAQQACEKAIKAVLQLQDIDYPLTHNLGLLWDLCKESKIICAVAKRSLTDLTPYAVEGRYGSLIEGISIDQLRKVMTATLAWATLEIEKFNTE